MNIFSVSASRPQRGFTLIELLLYVSIVGGILLSASTFFATVLEARVKNQSIAEVDQQGTLVMDLMTASIRNAASITTPAAGASGNSLTLAMTTGAINPTIINLSGATLQIKEGAGATVALTNSKVQVDSLTFTNLTRSGTPGVIRISLTLSRVNAGGKNEYSYQKTFVTSAALRWPL